MIEGRGGERRPLYGKALDLRMAHIYLRNLRDAFTFDEGGHTAIAPRA